MSKFLVLSLILAAVSTLIGIECIRSRRALARLRTRFAPIVSADDEAKRIVDEASKAAAIVRRDLDESKAKEAREVAAARVELETLRKKAEAEVAASKATGARELAEARSEVAKLEQQWTADMRSLEAQQEVLEKGYREGRTVYERLRSEIALLEENLENISFGVYRPHFTFQTSDEYKAALEELWEAEKSMIRDGKAAVSRGNWEVGGSKKDGERMTKQYTKLLVRSFNAECDAAIAKVSWSNLATMSERIRKSFDALNKLGTVMQMEILEPFRDLKLRELLLTHEQEEKKQQEKEEARRVREQMREEEKVQRELAAAEAEADKEERATEKELEKAKREAAKLDEEGQALMAKRIQELELQLAAAHAQKERVKAQAELTKCGHVYILSNTGSFGEEIVKIGMTRRLEPRERVAELGDASVPFPFDLHTLIYTENAPALEAELHNHFWEHRINLANDRKEFFRVPIAEVESYLCTRGLKCTFNRMAEAKEYRQTCSDRERAKAALNKVSNPRPDPFPSALFGAQSQSSPQ